MNGNAILHILNDKLFITDTNNLNYMFKKLKDKYGKADKQIQIFNNGFFF